MLVANAAPYIQTLPNAVNKVQVTKVGQNVSQRDHVRSVPMSLTHSLWGTQLRTHRGVHRGGAHRAHVMKRSVEQRWI